MKKLEIVTVYGDCSFLAFSLDCNQLCARRRTHVETEDTLGDYVHVGLSKVPVMFRPSCTPTDA